jgi:hypothetical protein
MGSSLCAHLKEPEKSVLQENVRWLSDEELVQRVDALASDERKLIAEIVAHLAEVERRKLHLALGYGSMFAYTTERLRFSEDRACRRIKAARLSVEHPEALEYLAKGELTLSSLGAVANAPELLEEARGKSKREVERMVAAKSPDSHPRRRRYLDADEEYEALLQEARDLCPGDELAVLKESLALFVAQRKKQRFAQVENPRSSSANPKGAISAATRREVFERDGGRCSFVGVDGKRCESTHLLEYDHVQPRALGGKHGADNLRLLCRSHNQYIAEKVFGEDKVELERASTALRRDALSALTNLGFKKSEARTAVDEVISPALPIESLVRAALRELRPHP